VDVFTVVADPVRRRILNRLVAADASAGELVAQFPRLSQPAVSRHLRILREARMVEVRGDRQRRIYQLRPEPLAELDAFIDRYRRFWAGRLDAQEGQVTALAEQQEEEE
jgi:DNA-binding transcriptional ArsR family regulator